MRSGPRRAACCRGRSKPLCWNELYTRDTASAAKFYEGLFGWTTQETPGAMGQPYTQFLLGEQAVGGMLEIQKE